MGRHYTKVASTKGEMAASFVRVLMRGRGAGLSCAMTAPVRVRAVAICLRCLWLLVVATALATLVLEQREPLLGYETRRSAWYSAGASGGPLAMK